MAVHMHVKTDKDEVCFTFRTRDQEIHFCCPPKDAKDIARWLLETTNWPSPTTADYTYYWGDQKPIRRMVEEAQKLDLP